MKLAPETEQLLRVLSPQVLSAVVRRHGDFTAAEDAVQEALFAAATRWPEHGLPENPRAWLIRVAARRLSDQRRADTARQRRETTLASEAAPEAQLAPSPDEPPVLHEDTLILLLMCCHPALTRPSAIALTLRAVGGLSTAEIAAAFFVPEATMAQRISRAKQTIKSSEIAFSMPEADSLSEALSAVKHALYLIFNEGYASSAGESLQRVDLAREAIRLTRMLYERRHQDPEIAGLLALMLLTDARRDARSGSEGQLIPLDEQDRSRWDQGAIAEGVALVTDAFSRGAVGPYQIQAAIAAVHDEAESAESTDWRQILALYGVLKQMSENPMVTLNHAIAAAMVHGPARGLCLLEELDRDARLAGHYRLDAVRAHLFERLADREAALTHYRRAAERTASVPERNYLLERAARLRER